MEFLYSAILTHRMSVCVSQSRTADSVRVSYSRKEHPPFNTYIDGTILFGFGPYSLFTQGLSVRQYMTQWLKRCTFSLRVPYSLKNRLVFYPYRPEKENVILTKTVSSNFKDTSIVTVPDHYCTQRQLSCWTPSLFIVHYLKSRIRIHESDINKNPRVEMVNQKDRFNLNPHTLLFILNRYL